MVVGILKLSLFIPGSNSLKEKRMVLESLKRKLRNNFNISVTQTDNEDKWQRAELVVAGVAKGKDVLDNMLLCVLSFVERFGKVVLIDYQKELL